MALLKIAAITAALALTAGAAAPPPNEELRYAIIIARHGVRAPTWTNERLNAYSSAPWPDWGVEPGYLTQHGEALMRLLGGFYVEYLKGQGLRGFADCSEPRKTYVWADLDQRTITSAKALAQGLSPECPAPVHWAEGKTADPLFDPIEAGESKAEPELGLAAVLGRIGPKPESVVEAHRAAFDTLDRILKGEEKPAKSIFDERLLIKTGDGAVAMTGPLRIASTLTENLLLEYTNGFRDDQLGWGRLNAKNLLEIMSLHTAYADLMRRSPYLARLRGGRLLRYVAQSLEQASTGKSRTSLLVISGHDTNLSNLSGLLNLTWALPSYQRDDVPPGGALMFTLWRSRTNGEFRVRTQFIAQTMDQMRDGLALSMEHPPAIADLFVPACSTGGAGYPCPLKQFLAAVQ
mgnify:CR=1 FL=1